MKLTQIKSRGDYYLKEEEKKRRRKITNLHIKSLIWKKINLQLLLVLFFLIILIAYIRDYGLNPNEIRTNCVYKNTNKNKKINNNLFYKKQKL